MQEKEEFVQRAIPLLDDLYRVALFLTKEKEEAEDLLQETYLRAWTFFEQFKKGTNIKGWLLQILYNTFKNEHRRKSRTVEHSDPDIGVKYSNDSTVESDFLENILDEEIEKAIKELPDEFREVIVLVDIGEMDYNEAARIMNCPIGTIRSRLSRGRNLLKTKLYEYAKARGYTK